jgi:hypothetical protein
MNASKFAVSLAAAALCAAAIPATYADPTPQHDTGSGAHKTATAYKAPLNAYGQPDLEGTWTNASLTVLERPAKFGDRKVMTDAEVKEVESADAKEVAAGNAPTDPKVKTTDLPYNCGRGFSGAGCGYNSGWIDPGNAVMRVNGEPRTSFITSTPNGRVPPYKPGATPGNPFAAMRAHYGENPENQTLGERCLQSFGNSAGPVMLPVLYNNNYEIAQSKDTVAILVEMVHDVRIIHIGAKHRTDGIRPWFGDSIGWYDGPTLVVETTNFPQQQAFRGSWKELKVTERFTRVAPKRVRYQFIVEDPTVWDTPWGGEYEFSPSTGTGIIYEYACHEGNYALEGILSGARSDEVASAAKAKATAEAAAAAPAPTAPSTTSAKKQ